MSKWETEHHFVSWLRLCPDNRISGEKIIGKGRLPTNNRVTTALRIAASNLRVSDTYLGAQFRRLRTKLGAPIAIKAIAVQISTLWLARLVDGLRCGERYNGEFRLLNDLHPREIGRPERQKCCSRRGLLRKCGRKHEAANLEAARARRMGAVAT